MISVNTSRLLPDRSRRCFPQPLGGARLSLSNDPQLLACGRFLPWEQHA
ncbi:hypothetical protein D5125_16995 [Magnetovirga frankeli]|nr:hypothetical protein D5125_16995 [gamma proteobacterium SS-5]